MRSIALLLVCKVEGFTTDNDVKRPLFEKNDTLEVAKEMLKMFSVHSFDEALVDANLLDLISKTQIDNENKLGTCLEVLPTNLNGGIIESTCREESQQLQCNFECYSDELDLLDINFTYDADISCRCNEDFAGIRFNVPCSWANIPLCAFSIPSTKEVSDNEAKCGPLIQEHGDWICDGYACALQCHHGYLVENGNNPMSARCLCSKHGDCRWQKPHECSRRNRKPNECDRPFHLLGSYQCTGYGHGDQCSLQCQNGFIREQYGIRECVCDNGGGCDWIGHGGTCTQDFGLSVLDQFDSSSLLSNTKCTKLPDVKLGKWRCSDTADDCTLICPTGLEPNQVVDIRCVCHNEHCMYGYISKSETRFGLTSSFESSIDFKCTDMYDFNMYEDDTLDKCLNLPDIPNGEWICADNGTCSLTCGEDTGGKLYSAERIVIDCLNSNSLDLDFTQLTCDMNDQSIMELEKKSQHQMPSKIKERLLY